LNEPVDVARFRKILAGIFVVFMALHLWFALRGVSSISTAAPDLFTLLWKAAATGMMAVAIYYFIFQRWLWRWRLLRPWLVKHPDLTGTWYAQFRGATFDTSFRSIVYIDHHFTSVSLTSVRPASRTNSVATTVVALPGNRLRLYIVYDSNVVVPLDGEAAPHGAEHSGCFRLDLAGADGRRKGRVLEGVYWTDKPRGADINDRGTWGRVSMRWQSRTLVSPEDRSARAFLAGDDWK
jgi:SMODS-associating 2TM, beta-strand rich effector domain